MKDRLEFGLGLSTATRMPEVLEKSIYAEELGFDSLWISDSPFQRYPFAVASAIAAKTREVRIAFGLVSPFLHSTRSIAGAVLSLIKTYGDRFELCVGPGDRNRLMDVGIVLPPAREVQECLLKSRSEILEVLGREGYHVRIWLGAQGPSTLKMASQFSGVLLNHASLPMVNWAMNQMGQTRNESFKIGVNVLSYVYRKRSNRHLFNRLREASILIALGASEAVLSQLRLQQKIERLKDRLELSCDTKSLLKDIPEQAFQNLYIYLEQKQLQSYLLNLRKLDVNLVVFGYPQDHSEKTIKELAEALRSENVEH